MLTRIYGITFPKDKELKEYLVLLEEAKKRDHRKLDEYGFCDQYPGADFARSFVASHCK
jgi:hypothetical protein